MTTNEWIASVFVTCWLAVHITALYLSDYWLDWWPDLREE